MIILQKIEKREKKTSIDEEAVIVRQNSVSSKCTYSQEHGERNYLWNWVYFIHQGPS